MKQALRFQSENEFQSFFSQLCSAEFPEFQAIEGSGGDRGFDGLCGKTAYQVYSPEDKNRTDAKFIEKIDKDLEKVIKNMSKLNLQIEEWIFVVPEDLRIGVVAHLQVKSNEKNIKCLYWGATKLTELVTKHPHIQDSFPTIFLPPVRNGIAEIENTLQNISKPTMNTRVFTDVEIIGDEEFAQSYKKLYEDYWEEVGPDSMRFVFEKQPNIKKLAVKVKQEEEKLKIKKNKSDSAYAIELEELDEYYNEEIEKIKEAMNKRGLYQSGIKDKAIESLEVKRKRDVSKLKLKYGITDSNMIAYNQRQIIKNENGKPGEN